MVAKMKRSEAPPTMPGFTLMFLLSLLLVGTGATALGAEPIRLGWQTPWATQGQLVVGLKYTNIPELVGVELEYPGFAYGGPLNLAALSGEVDVLLTADQPALVLLSRSDDWSIVGRMMYNRVCLYVPVASPIQKLQDLQGKSLLGPVGAAAERVALAALEDAGIDLGTMRLGKLDMAQQKALLARSQSRETRWSSADALYGFDPLPAIFETDGQARMIHCDKVVSVVVASRSMIEERRSELVAFLEGFYSSWHFFSQNGSIANAWFAKESRLEVGDEVLDRCASVEPNRWVKDGSALRLTFNDEDHNTMNEALTYLLERGIVKESFDPKTRINLGPLEAALAKDPSRLFARIKKTAAN